jgi:transposase
MMTCKRKAYPSDLTDAEWARLEPLILNFEQRVRPGPPTEVNLREVMNTLRYLNRSGCQRLSANKLLNYCLTCAQRTL